MDSSGVEVKGIRAGRDIGVIRAESMNTTVAAAGRHLDQVSIKHDVSFSTLASGLDIGWEGILFDGTETAGEGDIGLVKIGGDFIQSNIVAALATGSDGMFGTKDDKPKEKAIEEVEPPRIADVRFEGSQATVIVVKFEGAEQELLGNIHKVLIIGAVEGSEIPYPSQQFIIGGAGRVHSVVVNRQLFEGEANVLRKEVKRKSIEGTTIEVFDITAANASEQAFQVHSDGLDHEFGTADDVIISGDNDPNTEPTVYVRYDWETNEARFYNSQGFLTNRWGTNYYKIILDVDQIMNSQGIHLDGEFGGEWPSGDGTAGGENFEYIFAVGDLGDLPASGYAPFSTQSEFPDNVLWVFESQSGDNLQYSTDNAWYDQDYILLNNLQQGDSLEVAVTPEIEVLLRFAYGN